MYLTTLDEAHYFAEKIKHMSHMEVLKLMKEGNNEK